MPFRTLRSICGFFLDVIAVLTRSDHDRTVELLLLRQQRRPYGRRAQQPRASRWEKVALATLATRPPDLSRVALIFTPATLLRWQREIVRRAWTCDNRPKPGRPPIPATRVALILRLARENPTWGDGKIQGELLKLGHRAAKSTIGRLLRQHVLPPVPKLGRSTWRDFLGHYRDYLVACDVFPVDTVFLQRLYVLCFIELGSRRARLAGCTATPGAAWVTQQARRFTWHLQDGRPGSVRYLLHDRDGKFPPSFDTVFAAEDVEVVRTLYRAPTANSYAERWVRTVREECRDHPLIFGEKHLRRVLAPYTAHYNHERPHQGLGQAPPIPIKRGTRHGHVRRRDVLAGSSTSMTARQRRVVIRRGRSSHTPDATTRRPMPVAASSPRPWLHLVTSNAKRKAGILLPGWSSA